MVPTVMPRFLKALLNPLKRTVHICLVTLAELHQSFLQALLGAYTNIYIFRR